MFDRLLIANRGEIAVRIARTARALGIHTIAIHSDADAGAMHVRSADEAWHIGAAPASASYLDSARVVDAALRSGAQAIHPGYGFLSENADFSARCRAAGLIFVGPSPEAMAIMGSKSAARQCMVRAGVPVIPGYDGPGQEDGFLAEQAALLGYPLLIKASAGGGGRGMRRVDGPDTFAAALAACRREALAAFGDDRMLLERCVPQPRHIEFQVFGDQHGQCIHLFERDCSAQRRFQKVVEEAPAMRLPSGVRRAMGEAAVRAARAVDYVGAGTVEFLLGADGQFHFMEMNTRLQVEHPVTEAICGVDLVAWQLRIAAGEPLPLQQHEIQPDGHALEVRICAEDPERGFLPSMGRIDHLALPPERPWLRIDAGLASGDVVGPHYDSLLAKVIVHGPDRPTAVRRLRTVLDELRLVGPACNLDFLQSLVRHPEFLEGGFDTGLLERVVPASRALPPDDLVRALAALAELAAERRARRSRSSASGGGMAGWDQDDSFRLNLPASRSLGLFAVAATDEAPLRLSHLGLERVGSPGRQDTGAEADVLRIGLQGQDGVIEVAGALAPDGRLHYVHGGRQGQAWWLAVGETRHLWHESIHYRLQRRDPAAAAPAGAPAQGELRAPMPGRVIALLADPGCAVAAGAPLLILEAMKMEHTLHAPSAGRVQAWRCALGEQVTEGRELIDFLPEAG